MFTGASGAAIWWGRASRVSRVSRVTEDAYGRSTMPRTVAMCVCLLFPLYVHTAKQKERSTCTLGYGDRPPSILYYHGVFGCRAMALAGTYLGWWVAQPW